MRGRIVFFFGKLCCHPQRRQYLPLPSLHDHSVCLHLHFATASWSSVMGGSLRPKSERNGGRHVLRSEKLRCFRDRPRCGDDRLEKKKLIFCPMKGVRDG